MADTNIFTSAPNVSGVYYPQDYSINTLNFVTAANQKFEIKKLVAEMSYYEDIYTFAVSGYVTLTDAQGFIELFQLTGNEYLEFDFGKTSAAPSNIKRTFRVYKLAPRKPSGNMNVEFYTLHFCSEELILSEQTKISASYKGKKISENVRNILKENLKVPNNRIEVIEETTGINNLVAPKLRPFEAISWLSNYARPKSTGTVGADMLFFETKNGFNFRSLQSMYKEDIYTNYTYQAKNIDEAEQSLKEKATTVLKYEIVKSYDILNDINAGTLSNRLITLDPTTRTVRTTDFNYSNYKKSSSSLNSGEVTNKLKNRLGKTITESYEGSLKVSVGNAQQENNPYIKQQGVDTKDVFMENNVPNRTAQIALANYTIIKIVIPGDTGITTGRTVQFDLYTLKPTNTNKDLDKFYSGKYLVTAVRHIVTTPTEFQTVLELAKDSSPTRYVQRDSDSADSKSLSGSTQSFNSIKGLIGLK
jgi:hypothetical protein